MSTADPRDTGAALVTGATAGLGWEFTRQLAAAGRPVVLVARDAARLAERAAALSAEHGVPAEAIAADLETGPGLAAVEARLAAAEQPITLLVNNAGYGLAGDFAGNPVEQELAQHAVLTTAVLRLSHAAIRAFAGRGGGRILNVASVAAFVFGGSYSADKAWVVSFSRWANANHRDRGVTVTAVCPGFVRTEFHQRMGVDTGRLPGIAWLRPRPVVRAALAAAARGRSVSVPSLRYALAVALTRLLPPAWLVARRPLWRP